MDKQEMACDAVTHLIKAAKLDDLPVVLRFLLQHMSAANAPTLVTALRQGLSPERDDQASGGGGGGGETARASGESLVLDALQTALRLREVAATLLLRQLEGVGSAAEHRAIDWWLLVSVYSAERLPERRRRVLSAIANKVARSLPST